MTKDASWTAHRKSNGWGDGLAIWTDEKAHVAYLSVVFSWKLPDAYQRAVWYTQQGYFVRAGGPAVLANPDWLRPVAAIGGEVDALPHHNPNAVFTSRGCSRECEFCAVPIIEGPLVELEDWPARPVVCDNNLLACSVKHFERVIERLAPLQDVDFNQGLDARLLLPYHAKLIATLNLKAVRLAWDNKALEKSFLKAFTMLTEAGITADKIHVYVLIGWKDDPQDALYRLSTVRRLGAWPNPQRYEPLGALVKNSYVGPGWTDAELKRFMRYWANLAAVGHIPFDQFRHRGKEPKRVKIDPSQVGMGF